MEEGNKETSGGGRSKQRRIKEGGKGRREKKMNERKVERGKKKEGNKRGGRDGEG